MGGSKKESPTGTSVMPMAKATTTPSAAKMPNCCTAGILLVISEPNPIAVVRVQKKQGNTSLRTTPWMRVVRSTAASEASSQPWKVHAHAERQHHQDRWQQRRDRVHFEPGDLIEPSVQATVTPVTASGSATPEQAAKSREHEAEHHHRERHQRAPVALDQLADVVLLDRDARQVAPPGARRLGDDRAARRSERRTRSPGQSSSRSALRCASRRTRRAGKSVRSAWRELRREVRRIERRRCRCHLGATVAAHDLSCVREAEDAAHAGGCDAIGELAEVADSRGRAVAGAGPRAARLVAAEGRHEAP
jgi:hypothetical protein